MPPRALFPPPPTRSPRRVVVTGIGLVTPLGVGTRHTWSRLVNGHCGVVGLDAALACSPSRVAARVPRGTGPHLFDLEAAIGKSHSRTQGVDFIGMALLAAQEAITDARLLSMDGADAVSTSSSTVTPNLSGGLQPHRVGVAIGSGIGNIAEICSTALTLGGEGGVEAGARRVSPFFVPRILTNMAAGHVSIRYQLRGPNHSVSTACATGAHAIGDAFRFIKYGDADAMVAGGSEACIHPISLVGFSRAKALSTAFNDSPTRASRPFDTARDGFVLGEGAGILVLEELEVALRRGARIYAEIRGYGVGGDAHHITSPREDGSGALQCMEAALAEGGLCASDLDYVNAHATSTPVGDGIEATALGRLFGSREVQRMHKGAPCTANTAPGSVSAAAAPSRRVAVSSTKGAIGHLLGAAGSVEAAFSVLSIAEGVVPPTLNLDDCDPGLPTDVCEFVRGSVGQRREVRAALSNSFGFGGTNCSLLFTSAPT